MMSLPFIFLRTVVHVLLSWRWLSGHWRHLKHWTEWRRWVLWLHEVLQYRYTYLFVRAASLELCSLSLLLRKIESTSIFLHWWLLVLLLVRRLAFKWHPPSVDLHVGNWSKFVRTAELSCFELEVRLVRTAPFEFGWFPLVLCFWIGGGLDLERLIGRFVRSLTIEGSLLANLKLCRLSHFVVWIFDCW